MPRTTPPQDQAPPGFPYHLPKPQEPFCKALPGLFFSPHPHLLSCLLTLQLVQDQGYKTAGERQARSWRHA